MKCDRPSTESTFGATRKTSGPRNDLQVFSRHYRNFFTYDQMKQKRLFHVYITEQLFELVCVTGGAVNFGTNNREKNLG